MKLLEIEEESVKPCNLIQYNKHDNRMKIRTKSVPSSSLDLQASSVSTGHWPEKIPKKNEQDKKSTL